MELIHHLCIQLNDRLNMVVAEEAMKEDNVEDNIEEEREEDEEDQNLVSFFRRMRNMGEITQ